MLDFSPEKMLFIFFIVLIVLGPDKLPEVSRKIGRAMGELRKLSGGFRAEMNKAMNEMNAEPPSGGGGPPADLPATTAPPAEPDETSES